MSIRPETTFNVADRLFRAATAYLRDWWRPVPFTDDPILEANTPCAG